MAWVTFDRAVKGAENHTLKGPVDEWRALRDRIHREVCARGFDAARNSFRAAYDSDQLDASLLLLAQTGFVAPDDPRFVGTVEAIERELVIDGLVRRYRTHKVDDGLPPGEGAFLACSFWLADAYISIGRRDDARALFNRLLAIRNDLGLLINTAFNLTRSEKPAEQRANGQEGDKTPKGDPKNVPAPPELDRDAVSRPAPSSAVR
jgi:GH15 family glucan-1,4-alpha-glucosidase